MKKVLLGLALTVASLISYSQDVQITMLVQRDGGSNVQILVEDYGNKTYITMGGDIVVNVYDYNQKGQLFTYKISTDGQKMGAIYFNLDTDRFTVSLADGTTWNGDIIYKAQTI
jgi:hypothetical protein